LKQSKKDEIALLTLAMTGNIELLHGVYTEPFGFAQGKLRRRVPRNDRKICPSKC